MHVSIVQSTRSSHTAFWSWRSQPFPVAPVQTHRLQSPGPIGPPLAAQNVESYATGTHPAAGSKTYVTQLSERGHVYSQANAALQVPSAPWNGDVHAASERL